MIMIEVAAVLEDVQTMGTFILVKETVLEDLL